MDTLKRNGANDPAGKKRLHWLEVAVHYEPANQRIF